VETHRRGSRLGKTARVERTPPDHSDGEADYGATTIPTRAQYSPDPHDAGDDESGTGGDVIPPVPDPPAEHGTVEAASCPPPSSGAAWFRRCEGASGGELAKGCPDLHRQAAAGSQGGRILRRTSPEGGGVPGRGFCCELRGLRTRVARRRERKIGTSNQDVGARGGRGAT